jgi:hypothetical protein
MTDVQILLIALACVAVFTLYLVLCDRVAG